MKKLGSNMMTVMGKCMQACCLCMISCAQMSDMFSISVVNCYAA